MTALISLIVAMIGSAHGDGCGSLSGYKVVRKLGGSEFQIQLIQSPLNVDTSALLVTKTSKINGVGSLRSILGKKIGRRPLALSNGFGKEVDVFEECVLDAKYASYKWQFIFALNKCEEIWSKKDAADAELTHAGSKILERTETRLVIGSKAFRVPLYYYKSKAACDGDVRRER